MEEHLMQMVVISAGIAAVYEALKKALKLDERPVFEDLHELICVAAGVLIYGFFMTEIDLGERLAFGAVAGGLSSFCYSFVKRIVKASSKVKEKWKPSD